jgi:hypothetical protein
MSSRPNFLLIISEVTLVLLGVVLIVLALLKIIGLPASPLVIIILGAVLIYWALRAWMRKEPAAARLQTHIRAGSLAIVGLLMIAIPLAPPRYSNLLVATAGVVLVARGLLAGLLAIRRP